MRPFTSLILIALFSMASAQTVNTVQPGAWEAPSTWSCNCVPAAGASVVILHSVTLNGDLAFAFTQVQVAGTGEITTPFPVVVVITGTFIMEGHVFIAGTVTNAGGIMDISGYFEVAGNFHSDAQIAMDNGILQVEGDFVNTGSVSGQGSICVYGVTANEGAIIGAVDICDFTPTTATAPIVDSNTGTIAPTVTYCTNSTCATGIAEPGLARVSMVTGRVGEGVVLNGLPIGSVVTVVDALGHACMVQRASDARLQLDMGSFSDGVYRVIVRTDAAVRALPLILAH